MIEVEIQLITCNWKQELCTTETFQYRYFDTVIGNAKLQPSFFIFWVAQGIFYIVKFLATIFFIVKFV